MQACQFYYTAIDYDAKGPKKKSSLLLHLMGQRGIDIYNTFKFEAGTELNYDNVVASFNAYFCPKKNVDFERYKFMHCTQENLSIDAFVLKLKTLSRNCEFGEMNDSLVKTRIMCGVKSDKLRKRLLQETDLN